MFSINPMLACDFYKVSHKEQYPEGTSLVYSNLTPRSSTYAPKVDGNNLNKIVFFGLQYYIKAFLIDSFKTHFFNKPKEQVVAEFKRRCDSSLGKDSVDVSHIEALHDLGFLPIKIKALPEGALVPVKVPVITIQNTLPEFFWLTNYLETSMSAELWKMCTSATTAFQYRMLLEKFAAKTGVEENGVLFNAHDFSMRGMSGIHDAAMSGAGHLLSFLGTDTIPAIEFLEYYYNATNTFVGGSVPASEHSVMCIGGKDDEVETIRRLIKDVYPSGIVSVVSDSWDFWNVISNTSQILKEDILSRTPNELGMAKVVFRPDSGDPVKVLAGYKWIDLAENEFCDWELYDEGYEVIRDSDGKYFEIEWDFSWDGCIDSYELGREMREAEVKGAVECLWDVFGGTESKTGHKVLHERVGLIYGDSITLDRANDILTQLMDKGFASNNVVFGVGSYTYQLVTRDSYGFAMKATYGIVNGEGRAVFKDPVTDAGTKKSAKGLLRVEKVDGVYTLFDDQTPEQEQQGELKTVFLDGQLLDDVSLVELRQRIAEQL